MKKILVLCPHPENVAPGQRLKYEQYFDHFRMNDIEVHVSPFMTLSFWNIVYKKGFLIEKIFWTLYGYLKRIIDLFRLRKYDCIYVFLWVTPFGSTFFERITSFISKKLIYDIDDLVFLKPENKINSIAKFFKSEQKSIYLMKKSNHVITCTPYLDEFVRKYNNNTTDISSTINTAIYQPVNKYTNSCALTIGWSGSFSTSKYLKLLTTPLKKIQTKYNVKILVIGDETFHIDGLEIEAKHWSQKSEVSDLQRIDIGLYPLPNEKWVYGKSGLKALQYMALGIPTIATKIGANHRVIENDVSGFLVDSYKEWEEKLSLLIENVELRKKMGKKAVERVEHFYSINANKSAYLNVLKTVLNSK